MRPKAKVKISLNFADSAGEKILQVTSIVIYCFLHISADAVPACEIRIQIPQKYEAAFKNTIFKKKSTPASMKI